MKVKKPPVYSHCVETEPAGSGHSSQQSTVGSTAAARHNRTMAVAPVPARPLADSCTAAMYQTCHQQEPAMSLTIWSCRPSPWKHVCQGQRHKNDSAALLHRNKQCATAEAAVRGRLLSPKRRACRQAMTPRHGSTRQPQAAESSRMRSATAPHPCTANDHTRAGDLQRPGEAIHAGWKENYPWVRVGSSNSSLRPVADNMRAVSRPVQPGTASR